MSIYVHQNKIPVAVQTSHIRCVQHCCRQRRWEVVARVPDIVLTIFVWNSTHLCKVGSVKEESNHGGTWVSWIVSDLFLDQPSISTNDEIQTILKKLYGLFTLLNSVLFNGKVHNGIHLSDEKGHAISKSYSGKLEAQNTFLYIKFESENGPFYRFSISFQTTETTFKY